MDWAKRPERDTPLMQKREFHDARGRRWTGSITSGTVRGGEEHAEVIFVCRDQPNEQKRVGRLDLSPVDAGDRWREMAEEEIRDVFQDSEPA